MVLGKRKRLGLLEEHEIEQIGESIAMRAQSFTTLPQFETLMLERSA